MPSATGNAGGIPYASPALKPKRILLIRHGLTDANAAAVIQGHTQTRLNATGLAQARSLGAHLAQSGVRIASLVSSDLLRALQTAEAIAQACGLDVTPDPQWRERGFGPWEGKTLSQADIWRMASGEFDPPGAELSHTFQARIRQALLATADGCEPGGTVAIVTHGGPCRTALRLFASGELPMVPGSTKPVAEMIANCSITHLEAEACREGVAWRLVRLNDIDHLAAPARTAADAG